MKLNWKVVKPSLMSSYTFFQCSEQADYSKSGSAIYVFCKPRHSPFQFPCFSTKHLRIDAKRIQKEFITSINITTVLNFQSKIMKKVIMERCYPTHRQSYRWASFAPIFHQVFFGGTDEMGPRNTPAADRHFLFFSKKTFMCMDGQEQAVSHSVHWKTI